MPMRARTRLLPPFDRRRRPNAFDSTPIFRRKADLLTIRSERRTWFSVVLDCGGLLLQYLKTVRERLRSGKPRAGHSR